MLLRGGFFFGSSNSKLGGDGDFKLDVIEKCTPGLIEQNSGQRTEIRGGPSAGTVPY